MLILFFIVLLFVSVQNVESRELKVDVAVVPPMVTKLEAGYSGFDVDLWEAIADELDVATSYREVLFPQIFDGIKRGEADLAMAGITITAEREKLMDFSHHYFDSGLQILVLPRQISTLRYILDVIIENKMYKWLLYLLGFVFFFGNVVWIFERGKGHMSLSYFPGVFEACWFSIVTAVTVGYGDMFPKTWCGRAVASAIMIFGIYFVLPMITGNMSTAMMVERMKHTIKSPRDLHGKRVATLAGSTSVDDLEKRGAHVHAVIHIENAFALLQSKKVDAVVFDVPIILYYNMREGASTTMITGPKFEEQYYGIALQEGSELREPVNRALLKLQENGVYEKIYKKWFGDQEK